MTRLLLFNILTLSIGVLAEGKTNVVCLLNAGDDVCVPGTREGSSVAAADASIITDVDSDKICVSSYMWGMCDQKCTVAVQGDQWCYSNRYKGSKCLSACFENCIECNGEAYDVTCHKIKKASWESRNIFWYRIWETLQPVVVCAATLFVVCLIWRYRTTQHAKIFLLFWLSTIYFSWHSHLGIEFVSGVSLFIALACYEYTFSFYKSPNERVKKVFKWVRKLFMLKQVFRPLSVWALTYLISVFLTMGSILSVKTPQCDLARSMRYFGSDLPPEEWYQMPFRAQGLFAYSYFQGFTSDAIQEHRVLAYIFTAFFVSDLCMGITEIRYILPNLLIVMFIFMGNSETIRQVAALVVSTGLFLLVEFSIVQHLWKEVEEADEQETKPAQWEIEFKLAYPFAVPIVSFFLRPMVIFATFFATLSVFYIFPALFVPLLNGTAFHHGFGTHLAERLERHQAWEVMFDLHDLSTTVRGDVESEEVLPQFHHFASDPLRDILLLGLVADFCVLFWCAKNFIWYTLHMDLMYLAGAGLSIVDLVSDFLFLSLLYSTDDPLLPLAGTIICGSILINSTFLTVTLWSFRVEYSKLAYGAGDGWMLKFIKYVFTALSIGNLALLTALPGLCSKRETDKWLQHCFEKADINGNGSVDCEEIAEYLSGEMKSKKSESLDAVKGINMSVVEKLRHRLENEPRVANTVYAHLERDSEFDQWGIEIGQDVANDALGGRVLVRSILPKQVFHNWNSRQKGEKIEEGDEIIAINGESLSLRGSHRTSLLKLLFSSQDNQISVTFQVYRFREYKSSELVDIADELEHESLGEAELHKKAPKKKSIFSRMDLNDMADIGSVLSCLNEDLPQLTLQLYAVLTSDTKRTELQSAFILFSITLGMFSCAKVMILRSYRLCTHCFRENDPAKWTVLFDNLALNIFYRLLPFLVGAACQVLVWNNVIYRTHAEDDVYRVGFMWVFFSQISFFAFSCYSLSTGTVWAQSMRDIGRFREMKSVRVRSEAKILPIADLKRERWQASGNNYVYIRRDPRAVEYGEEKVTHSKNEEPTVPVQISIAERSGSVKMGDIKGFVDKGQITWHDRTDLDHKWTREENDDEKKKTSSARDDRSLAGKWKDSKNGKVIEIEEENVGKRRLWVRAEWRHELLEMGSFIGEFHPRTRSIHWNKGTLNLVWVARRQIGNRILSVDFEMLDGSTDRIQVHQDAKQKHTCVINEEKPLSGILGVRGLIHKQETDEPMHMTFMPESWPEYVEFIHLNSKTGVMESTRFSGQKKPPNYPPSFEYPGHCGSLLSDEWNDDRTNVKKDEEVLGLRVDNGIIVGVRTRNTEVKKDMRTSDMRIPMLILGSIHPYGLSSFSNPNTRQLQPHRMLENSIVLVTSWINVILFADVEDFNNLHLDLHSFRTIFLSCAACLMLVYFLVEMEWKKKRMFQLIASNLTTPRIYAKGSRRGDEFTLSYRLLGENDAEAGGRALRAVTGSEEDDSLQELNVVQAVPSFKTELSTGVENKLRKMFTYIDKDYGNLMGLSEFRTLTAMLNPGKAKITKYKLPALGPEVARKKGRFREKEEGWNTNRMELEWNAGVISLEPDGHRLLEHHRSLPIDGHEGEEKRTNFEGVNESNAVPQVYPLRRAQTSTEAGAVSEGTNGDYDIEASAETKKNFYTKGTRVSKTMDAFDEDGYNPDAESLFTSEVYVGVEESCRVKCHRRLTHINRVHHAVLSKFDPHSAAAVADEAASTATGGNSSRRSHLFALNPLDGDRDDAGGGGGYNSEHKSSSGRRQSVDSMPMERQGGDGMPLFTDEDKEKIEAQGQNRGRMTSEREGEGENEKNMEWDEEEEEETMDEVRQKETARFQTMCLFRYFDEDDDRVLTLSEFMVLMVQAIQKEPRRPVSAFTDAKFNVILQALDCESKNALTLEGFRSCYGELGNELQLVHGIDIENDDEEGVSKAIEEHHSGLFGSAGLSEFVHLLKKESRSSREHEFMEHHFRCICDNNQDKSTADGITLETFRALLESVQYLDVPQAFSTIFTESKMCEMIIENVRKQGCMGGKQQYGKHGSSTMTINKAGFEFLLTFKGQPKEMKIKLSHLWLPNEKRALQKVDMLFNALKHIDGHVPVHKLNEVMKYLRHRTGYDFDYWSRPTKPLDKAHFADYLDFHLGKIMCDMTWDDIMDPLLFEFVHKHTVQNADKLFEETHNIIGPHLRAKDLTPIFELAIELGIRVSTKKRSFLTAKEMRQGLWPELLEKYGQKSHQDKQQQQQQRRPENDGVKGTEGSSSSSLMEALALNKPGFLKLLEDWFHTDDLRHTLGERLYSEWAEEKRLGEDIDVTFAAIGVTSEGGLDEYGNKLTSMITSHQTSARIVARKPPPGLEAVSGATKCGDVIALETTIVVKTAASALSIVIAAKNGNQWLRGDAEERRKELIAKFESMRQGPGAGHAVDKFAEFEGTYEMKDQVIRIFKNGLVASQVVPGYLEDDPLTNDVLFMPLRLVVSLSEDHTSLQFRKQYDVCEGGKRMPSTSTPGVDASRGHFPSLSPQGKRDDDDVFHSEGCRPSSARDARTTVFELRRIQSAGAAGGASSPSHPSVEWETPTSWIDQELETMNLSSQEKAAREALFPPGVDIIVDTPLLYRSFKKRSYSKVSCVHCDFFTNSTKTLVPRGILQELEISEKDHDDYEALCVHDDTSIPNNLEVLLKHVEAKRVWDASPVKGDPNVYAVRALPEQVTFSDYFVIGTPGSGIKPNSIMIYLGNEKMKAKDAEGKTKSGNKMILKLKQLGKIDYYEIACRTLDREVGEEFSSEDLWELYKRLGTKREEGGFVQKGQAVSHLIHDFRRWNGLNDRKQ